MNPRFPIYIPSKSRAKIATTPRFLGSIGVPYRLVVEADQYDEYAEYFPADRLLVLDPAYQETYPLCDEDSDPRIGKGSGPARNFIWDHSIAEGADWHWVIDDNIRNFLRLHENQRIIVGDGTIFHAMETFGLRYKNIGMLGPHYKMFAPSRSHLAPFIVGTRVYSCSLIRNSVPFRWRCRYNEDTILSLDLLKAGWATVQFFAFLQDNLTTQLLPGGNTEAFYATAGTLPKSQMLVREHPDVAELTWKFGRWHHQVDYSEFRKLQLIPDPDYDPADELDYKLRLVLKR